MTPKIPMTSGEEVYYDFIFKFIQEHKYAPNFEDMGMRNSRMIDRLKDKGWLTYTKGVTRSIVLTDGPLPYLPPSSVRSLSMNELGKMLADTISQDDWDTLLSWRPIKKT